MANNPTNEAITTAEEARKLAERIHSDELIPREHVAHKAADALLSMAGQVDWRNERIEKYAVDEGKCCFMEMEIAEWRSENKLLQEEISRLKRVSEERLKWGMAILFKRDEWRLKYEAAREFAKTLPLPIEVFDSEVDAKLGGKRWEK